MRSPSRSVISRHTTRARFRWPVAMLLAGTCATVLLSGAIEAPWAGASPTGVGLGNATPFAVLGASGVTNTGASLISGDLGVSPGTSVTGGPDVINGTIYQETTVAATAQGAVGTAYTDAAGRSKTTPTNFTTTGLAGKSLVAGVYNASSQMLLTGTLTLNGNDDPNSVFVFQAGSTLTTASNSTVKLTGGAQACNVFWQVTSSATLGSSSTFVGTILALASITVTSDVKVTGRLLAHTAAVTLIDDTITRPSTCITATSISPAISAVTPSSGPTSGGTTVVITGSDLSSVTGTTGVMFGTVPATTYTVTSTTTITATAPAGTGVVTITVTAAGTEATKTGAFTYEAPTTITTATTTTTTPPAATTTTTTSPVGTGSSSTTLNSGTVIPVGAPQTGMGGASRSGGEPILLAAGALAFAGAAASLLLAVRRRRATS